MSEQVSLSPPAGWLKAFRVVDHFVLEGCKAASGLRGASGDGLARDLRAALARAGSALLGASACGRGSAREAALLEEARARLVEATYVLYLARRLGLLELRPYRALAGVGEAAGRELAALAGSRPEC